MLAVEHQARFEILAERAGFAPAFQGSEPGVLLD